MAVIVDGERRIPFLRGMLTHYLLEQGLSFQDAYSVADKIRSDIQKRKTIPAEKMVALVHAHVGETDGDPSIGDGFFWRPRTRNVVVEDADGFRPFSRERLTQSIAMAGVAEEEAYALAERLLGQFLSENRDAVSRADIQKAVSASLKAEYGTDYAQRYRVWHRFRGRGTQPLILLIGGSSGVGKTSVGVAVANRLKISRVASTDDIRQVMRLMIAPNLMPGLHVSSYQAWEFVTASQDESDPVVSGFREQALRVCVGVRGAIERAIQENVSLIIDGVHLIPDLLQLEPFEDRAIFIHANLFLADEAQFRERYTLRGEEAEGRPSHQYLKHLNQIMTIQSHILHQGEAVGTPAYVNNDFDETVQTVCLQIMDHLRENWSKKG